jgi:hypothetical protein
MWTISLFFRDVIRSMGAILYFPKRKVVTEGFPSVTALVFQVASFPLSSAKEGSPCLCALLKHIDKKISTGKYIFK